MGHVEARESAYQFLGMIGDILAREVPGTTYMVDRLCDYEWGALGVQYDCPCGEVSRFGLTTRSMSVDAESTWDPRVEAELLKEVMRRHVRREGNEPSF